MLYFLLFLLKLLISASVLLAQDTSTIDSLKNELSSEHDNHIRVDIFNDLAWFSRFHDYNEASGYALQANALAKSLGDKKREATSLVRLGGIEEIKGNLDKAIQLISQALVLERDVNHKYGVARAQSMLSSIYRHKKEYNLAVESGKESLDIFIELGNPSSIARAYQRLISAYQEKGEVNNAMEMLIEKQRVDSLHDNQKTKANTLTSFGSAYYQLKSYNKALDYYLKAKMKWEDLGDTSELANALTRLGAIYIDSRDYNLGEGYIRESISLNNLHNYGTANADNYTNLGIVYSSKYQYDSAIACYQKSIALDKSLGEKASALAFYGLGNTHKRQGRTDSALSMYEKVLAVNPQSARLLMETSWNLIDLYSEIGEFQKADSLRNAYGVLKDSLDRITLQAIVVKDSFEREQNRNQLLAKDLKIKNSELARSNILIYALVGGSILILILFFSILKNRQLKQAALISQKDAEIRQQKIDEMLKTHELKEMSAMMEGQEQERKRIAQDLHDRLGSMLSMVKIHFKTVEENIESIQEENRKQYEKADSLLDEACEEVRKIAHDMVSGVLKKFGLVPAIRSLSKSVNETGQLKIEVLDFGIENDERLDYEIEINVYRIIQELLSNTLKHAEASEMTIQIIKKEGNLNLLVEDNGKGFDSDNVQDTGIGLKNMQARVDKLNGELNIDSGKGSGTTVSMDIPITKEL
ncbi:MAG: sensor histidine kinase [Bacteroidota bacterium]